MVRIATFNLEYGAEAYGRQRAAEIIRKSGADVVLLQEIYSSKKADMAQQLSENLEWYCITFPQSQTAILSRKKSTRIGEGSHFGIAKIGKVYYCVVHLSHTPYIPSEASGIAYPVECVHDHSCFHSTNPEVLIQRSLTARKEELRDLVRSVVELKPNR